MKYIQLPLGPLQTNCYILYDENRNCVVIDPGEQGKELVEFIKKERLHPLAVLLTHAHFDHIGAVDEVRASWNVPVYLHVNEAEWISNPSLNGSKKYGFLVNAKPADTLLEKEETLEIGAFTISVLHTPGHSPGSVSYYWQENNVIVAGDTLFAGSVGRTDLLDGDHGLLIRSIKQKILTLPPSTIVLPGHGPETTVEKETDENPFLHEET